MTLDEKAMTKRIEELENAAWRVWNTVPAEFSGSQVEEHAAALNALRAVLEKDY